MEKIYHYTSTDGFYSIVNNQTLRFTHSDFLNDPQDCKIFFTIIQKYIDELNMNGGIKKIIETTRLKKYKKYDMDRVVELFDKYPITEYLTYVNQHIDMYILSLTSSKDSLPMWNYYGGGGMQVGFNSELLISKLREICCKDKNHYLACTNVQYIDDMHDISKLEIGSFSDIDVRYYCGKYQTTILNSKEKDKNLSFLIDTYIESYLYTIYFLIKQQNLDIIFEKEEFYKNVFEYNKNSVNDKKFKADVDLYMLLIGAFYKPDTYENEEEVRLVYVNYDTEPEDCIDYAISNSTFGKYIRPYIEFKFNTPTDLGRTIESVRFSPSTKNMPIDATAYHKAVRGLIKSTLHVDVQTKDSKRDIRW